MGAMADEPDAKRVDTDGGAYVDGSVDTGGGDFIGRDQITIIDKRVIYEGENLREKELAYLDGLLKKYEYWRDHYTPLAGIAEVRSAVQDGPRLDLPMPFIPPEFEKLVEHGYGPRTEVHREPVDDIRETVAKHKRILLLGEPGSGKTTTLWWLAYEYATKARDDASKALPVTVPLGGYNEDGPFDTYLARQLGPLTSYLGTYRASERLILLLDGLNEMPQADFGKRVEHIQEVLNQYPDETVIVTCRALDYAVKLKGLQRVEISPLDYGRIRAFLHNYLGQTAGERLFWAMTDEDEEAVRGLWEAWQRAGCTFSEFWTAEEMPLEVRYEANWAQVELWERLRQASPNLMDLSRNPYLLLMMAQVYAAAGSKLPANRARLFAAFVNTLLAREQKRHPDQWIEAENQKAGLAALAHQMQWEGKFGTTVDRAWALEQLCNAVPDCDPGRLLYLATSATLLDSNEATVRFYHQLLQEYFAACELGHRIKAGESLTRYWPQGRWWKSSGWEETTILLAGMETDPTALLQHLVTANTVLASRCLTEGDVQVSDAVRARIITALLPIATHSKRPPEARVQAGVQLAHLGDPRNFDELVTVPAGPFLMGSSDDDEMAKPNEKPQHEVSLAAFKIGKYPVTNAQYRAFVDAGGYNERRYWTNAGWEQKERQGWTGPVDLGTPFVLCNHPVVGVSWYEAVAYCTWLTEVWRAEGKIGPGEVVRLPTEAEWEKAARGTDQRVYPWGNRASPNRANYHDTGIGSTSAVGCFPSGASPYGCFDMAGNVWEWGSSLFRPYPYQVDDGREDPDPLGDRVERGGSWIYNQDWARCASRYWDFPDMRDSSSGFRVVVSPISPASAL